MKRMIIKVKRDAQSKPIEFEVPGERPVREVVAHLAQGLGWPLEDGGRPIEYRLETGGGPIAGNKNLTEAGVKNGDVLLAQIGSAPSAPTRSGPAAPGVQAWSGKFETLGLPQNDSPQDRRASIRPPDGWRKAADE